METLGEEVEAQACKLPLAKELSITKADYNGLQKQSTKSWNRLAGRRLARLNPCAHP
jgi:hypothetical protein